MKILMLSLLSALAFSNSTQAEDSIPVGVTRFRIETPKAEPQMVSSARYVLDSKDELSASCPANTKLVWAACNADVRSFQSTFISENIFNGARFTSTSSSEGKAHCNAVFVHPDEILKLSLTLKCEQNNSDVATR